MRAHLQRPVRDRPEPHAPKAHHRVADGLAHVAHLARASLVQRDGEERLVLARPETGVDEADDGGGRAAAVDRDPSPQPLELVLAGHAAHAREILALDFMLRMQQPLHELAVVRQQQQALGVVVEAADGVDVLPHVGQQVEHGRPALGVLPRRHVAAGLVEEDVAVALRDADALPVEADVVVIRIGPRAECEDRRPIHRDAAVRDEDLGGAPRRDTGGREDLLESLAADRFGHPVPLVPRPYCRSRLAKKSTSCQISRRS